MQQSTMCYYSIKLQLNIIYELNCNYKYLTINMFIIYLLRTERGNKTESFSSILRNTRRNTFTLLLTFLSPQEDHVFNSLDLSASKIF